MFIELPESLRSSRDSCPVSAGGHCGCFLGVRFKGRELKAWLLLRKAGKKIRIFWVELLKIRSTFAE